MADIRKSQRNNIDVDRSLLANKYDLRSNRMKNYENRGKNSQDLEIYLTNKDKSEDKANLQQLSPKYNYHVSSSFTHSNSYQKYDNISLRDRIKPSFLIQLMQPECITTINRIEEGRREQKLANIFC